MTHTVITPIPPRTPSLTPCWPMPSTITTTTQPNQYFPQGPIGR